MLLYRIELIGVLLATLTIIGIMVSHIWLLYNNRKSLNWQYSNMTQDIDNESLKLDLEIKKKTLTAQISVLIIALILSLILLCFPMVIGFRIADTDINLASQIITKYYTSKPEDLSNYYNDYLRDYIDYKVEYLLDTDNLYNLLYRHKEYTSTDTEINFLSITSNNKGQVTLIYNIIPKDKEPIIRCSVFNFFEHKIINYQEYDLTDTVQYAY